MQHNDYVTLLKSGVPAPGGVWADFGSGQGAYTLALAELLGPESTIYSVDKDESALRTQAKLMGEKFPAVKLTQIPADFTMPITPALPPLDGLLLANTLHLFPEHQKPDIVRQLKRLLKPGGRLILVDYNADSGNSWVPYPLSFNTWQALALKFGFESVRQLGTYPSNFLKEFYSAEALVPQPPPPPAPKPVVAKAPAATPAKAPAAAAPAPAEAAPAEGEAKKTAAKKKSAPSKTTKKKA
jgi:ubiquinone/menaquinone biosynthesis C-methylase UbiE